MAIDFVYYNINNSKTEVDHYDGYRRGDPDDQQSMVRLMTLANKFDIEGLLACSTLTRKNATTTRPEVIAEIINTYRDVRQNLLIHEPGFPTKIFLLSQIKRRLANQFKIGKDYDTEASD